jgi:hypothetical protein
MCDKFDVESVFNRSLFKKSDQSFWRTHNKKLRKEIELEQLKTQKENDELLRKKEKEIELLKEQLELLKKNLE